MASNFVIGNGMLCFGAQIILTVPNSTPGDAKDLLNLMVQMANERLETLAEEDYEEARKEVSGRPAWKDLNPRDPYDMGMREFALQRAAEKIIKSLNAKKVNYRDARS